MRRHSSPAVPGRMHDTNVGVWGVSAWDANLKWGTDDPRRDFLSVDRYDGQAFWGRHCWASDFWLRW